MIDQRHISLIKTAEAAREQADYQDRMARQWLAMGRDTVAWECEYNARKYREHAQKLSQKE